METFMFLKVAIHSDQNIITNALLSYIACLQQLRFLFQKNVSSYKMRDKQTNSCAIQLK
ncbi:hypothetical protein FVB9288_03104 [Flavobacterium sp. CECT 9288]|nr:hypothetical protein FVB9288_03104 [Flavobacterium sp. CECT 9288]